MGGNKKHCHLSLQHVRLRELQVLLSLQQACLRFLQILSRMVSYFANIHKYPDTLSVILTNFYFCIFSKPIKN